MRERKLTFERLEDRRMLTLTVIVHGLTLGSTEPAWVQDMARAINQSHQLGCTNAEIEQSVVDYEDANDPPASDSCGDFLLFDWSQESSIFGTEQDAADRLVAALRGQLALSNPVDVHLIGHSRGAFVISDAIAMLTSSDFDKIGNLHMTTLDGESFPFGRVLTVPTGVDQADNYYQTSDTLNGHAVLGAVNVDLTGTLANWTSGNSPHSQVREWYHWTVDTTDTDGVPSYRDASIRQTQAELASEADDCRSTSDQVSSNRSTLFPFVSWNAGCAVGDHWTRNAGGPFPTHVLASSQQDLFYSVSDASGAEHLISSVDPPAGAEFAVFPSKAIQIESSDRPNAGSAAYLLYPYSSAETANTYFQFGASEENSDPHWYEFLFDGQTGARMIDGVVELHTMDGARGDSSPAADQIFESIGGPAFDPLPWHNRAIAEDINADGQVGLQDAFIEIDAIRTKGVNHSLPLYGESITFNRPRFDVTGNNSVGLTDAFSVIDAVRDARGGGAPEGEVAHHAPPATATLFDLIIGPYAPRRLQRRRVESKDHSDFDEADPIRLVREANVDLYFRQSSVELNRIWGLVARGDASFSDDFQERTAFDFGDVFFK